jgi:hypothetical protein
VAGETGFLTRRVVVTAAVAVAAAALGVGFFGCGRPPQMGPDEAVFAAVDALFTAVTARDEKLLRQCEQRLDVLRGAGKLSADAADYLAGVIGKARAGRWESAAERLYGFMTAQRREGERHAHGKHGKTVKR